MEKQGCEDVLIVLAFFLIGSPIVDWLDFVALLISLEVLDLGNVIKLDIHIVFILASLVSLLDIVLQSDAAFERYLDLLIAMSWRIGLATAKE